MAQVQSLAGELPGAVGLQRQVPVFIIHLKSSPGLTGLTPILPKEMEASSSYGKFQTLQSKRMAESELRPRSPALDVNSSLLTTSTFPPRMTQLDHAPNRCHYQKCTLLLKNKTKKQTYLSDPDATSKEVPEENGFQCH